jgi:hypothetical protein
MRPPLLIALAAICSACASTDEDGPELGTTNVISLNSLAPAAFMDNWQPLADLAAGPLEGAPTELLNSGPGQSLLSYVVRCAAPQGSEVRFPLSGGGEHVLNGQLGLAPDWRGAALSEVGQRLITGCLIVHLNAFEVAVQFSVRTEALGEPSSPEEVAQFTEREITAYGNAMHPDPAQRTATICSDEAVHRAFGAGGGLPGERSYSSFRVCGEGSCLVPVAGACYSWSHLPAVTTWTCETQSGSFYPVCHERVIQEMGTPGQQQTVSALLTREGFQSMQQAYEDEVCASTSAVAQAACNET